MKVDGALETLPLARLVAIAGVVVSARWSDWVAASGVAAGELALLLELNRGDGLSHREAARRCWISPAALTGVVDTLEEQGLAERRRDPADRRVVRLFLTDGGRELVRRTHPQLQRDMAPVRELLTDDEEAIVRRFLVEVIRRLHPQEGREQWT